MANSPLQPAGTDQKTESNESTPRTRERGFATMDQARQREIASRGGRAAHQQGTAHEFTSQEAREAGRKGGQAISRDRQHMREIGRKGGENSRGGRARSAARVARVRGRESGRGGA